MKETGPQNLAHSFKKLYTIIKKQKTQQPHIPDSYIPSTITTEQISRLNDGYGQWSKYD